MLRPRHVLTFAATAALALAFAGSAGAARFVVVYSGHLSQSVAERHVARAGGELVAAHPEIDVVVAESSNPGFEAAIERFSRVEGAAATAAVAAASSSQYGDWGPDAGSLPNEPAADTDTFSPRQWGLAQIHATDAHQITGGSPAVLVGHIDTGIDFTHPDLAPNLDLANSVSCVSGAPNQDPAAWDDDSGHGTHTAGIIAAASNGTGVVGVAPNVRIAAIKASIRQGTSDIFLPEAVICSFMWAASHGVDVTNNSYSVDSALVGGTTFFCRDDPEQRVVVKALRRSVRWAMRRGVSVVASAGNTNSDLVANECLRLPSELPGVVTVAATGILGQRSAYSNYGLGVVDVAAPGGEVTQGGPPPGNLVLSSWPAKFPAPTLLCDPVGVPCFPGPTPGVSYYRYALGTSQAAAHATGVAALVVSRFGRDRWSFRGQMRPKRVERILKRTADPQPCPADPACIAHRDVNGYYGHGIVNALRAVSAHGEHDDDHEHDGHDDD
jgi:lantibiotic leader peptide-processing serine protease